MSKSSSTRHHSLVIDTSTTTADNNKDMKEKYSWKPFFGGLCIKNKNNNDDDEKKQINDMKMAALLPCTTELDQVKLTDGNVKLHQKSSNRIDVRLIITLSLFFPCFFGTLVMWFTDIYNDEIFKRLTLANNSKVHVAWKNPPLEPLLCVRVFNYTNTEEYLDSNKEDNITLKVEELGPYCYRELIERFNITFEDNNTRLSYNERRVHTFDREASVGNEDDQIIVPNIPLITANSLHINSILKFTLNSFFSSFDQDLFKSLMVKDFLFGYTDIIVNSMVKFGRITGKSVPYEKFGILIKRAGTSQDIITISTGEDDLEEMGQVQKLNGNNMFHTWNTSECNQMAGSDGLFFQRSRVKNMKQVSIFYKDACRDLPLEYVETVEVGEGIKANRYVLYKDLFNVTKTESACYCISDLCSVNGVFEVTPCASDVPMVMSRPHLLNSQVLPQETVEGLHPDVKNHTFHIDIYPPLGLTVRTVMRMQLNVVVRNSMHLREYGPMGERMILPVVWVEMNSGEVPEKMFSLLYFLTYTKRWIELLLMWSLLLISLCCIAYFIKKIKNKNNKEKIVVICKINDSDDYIEKPF